MKTIRHFILYLLSALSCFSGFAQSANKSTIKGEEVIYTSHGLTMKGYIAYDAAMKTKRPAVLVVHEWWGCNEYARMRARMLASLGYIAMAVDMYGDGKVAPDPKMAGEYATPFYEDVQLGRERLQAAYEKLKTYSQTDAGKMAAIGYCFGGSMVLNAAKLGMDLRGVVSFHGSLGRGAGATPGSTKARILVCHGGGDKYVSKEDILQFKQNLDSMKVSYQFIVYPGATHAFTNPGTTAMAKKFNMPLRYDPAADKKSWNDMRVFLKKVFSE